MSALARAGEVDEGAHIRDLLEGQYSDAVRMVAFKTAESWSRDVSEEIADELALRLTGQDRETPTRLAGFTDRHGNGRPVQLPLP